MPDFTIIVTTLGAAAISGAVGAFGAHKQAENSRDLLEAENTRLRLQFSEANREKRREAYEGLLNSTFAFGLIAGGYRSAEEGDIDQWLERYQGHLHSVSILGRDRVREWCTYLDSQLLLVLKDYRDGAPGVPSPQRLKDPYEARRAEIVLGYTGMLEAMRADIEADERKTLA